MNRLLIYIDYSSIPIDNRHIKPWKRSRDALGETIYFAKEIALAATDQQYTDYPTPLVNTVFCAAFSRKHTLGCVCYAALGWFSCLWELIVSRVYRYMRMHACIWSSRVLVNKCSENTDVCTAIMIPTAYWKGKSEEFHWQANVEWSKEYSLKQNGCSRMQPLELYNIGMYWFGGVSKFWQVSSHDYLGSLILVPPPTRIHQS
jgi:hypothetical protein